MNFKMIKWNVQNDVGLPTNENGTEITTWKIISSSINVGIALHISADEYFNKGSQKGHKTGPKQKSKIKMIYDGNRVSAE